jgi:malonyl-CoA/methylmalonyl-CoA synthetase
LRLFAEAIKFATSDPHGQRTTNRISVMNENLYALLQQRFPTDRSRPVIEKADGTLISYAEMEETSARMAALLVSLGLEKGDRVAVQVEKSPENMFLYLATLRAGGVYLPLNTAYQKGEIAYFLGDAEPKVMVCRPENEATVRQIANETGTPHVLTLDPDGDGSLTEGARDQKPLYEVTDCEPDDLAAICYTSGTTGRSKGAMITHRNLSSNAFALHEIWGFEPGDVLLHALPIFHVHGLFVAINTSLANGSKMFFLPKFDAVEVVGLLPRATVMMGVPTFYVRLLQHPEFGPEVCRNMRLFVSGSAPLLEETFEDFQTKTGHTILERYGMTEAGMITSNPYDGQRIAGTVGYPLPGVEVRVCDEDGKELPTGEIGVLEVRGPNVFKGYWRMPEKTAEEFRDDGFFITGDVAKLDEDGRVSIVGRAKDLIISGGYNVYPKEIELVIDALPGVGESAVFGVPHPDFGEAVTAAVTRDPKGGNATEEAIVYSVKGELANFKVPKRVFFVDELPRNAMGKVQKNQLRDRYAATFK